MMTLRVPADKLALALTAVPKMAVYLSARPGGLAVGIRGHSCETSIIIPYLSVTPMAALELDKGWRIEDITALKAAKNLTIGGAKSAGWVDVTLSDTGIDLVTQRGRTARLKAKADQPATYRPLTNAYCEVAAAPLAAALDKLRALPEGMIEHRPHLCGVHICEDIDPLLVATDGSRLVTMHVPGTTTIGAIKPSLVPPFAAKAIAGALEASGAGQVSVSSDGEHMLLWGPTVEAWCPCRNPGKFPDFTRFLRDSEKLLWVKMPTAELLAALKQVGLVYTPKDLDDPVALTWHGAAIELVTETQPGQMARTYLDVDYGPEEPRRVVMSVGMLRSTLGMLGDEVHLGFYAEEGKELRIRCADGAEAVIAQCNPGYARNMDWNKWVPIAQVVKPLPPTGATV